MRQISDDEREDARIQAHEQRGERRLPRFQFPAQDDTPSEEEQDEVTAEVELTLPAGRAFHNLNNGLQILVGYDLLDAEVQAAARDSLRERIQAVLPDLTALQQLLDRQESVLAELREEGVRMAQYIVRLEDAESKRVQEVADLRERLATATRLMESLYEATDADVGLAAVRHSRVLRLRAALTNTTHDTPRLAVAGGK